MVHPFIMTRVNILFKKRLLSLLINKKIKFIFTTLIRETLNVFLLKVH